MFRFRLFSFNFEIFFKVFIIMNNMIVLFGLSVVSAICIFLLVQSYKQERYYTSELNKLNKTVAQLSDNVNTSKKSLDVKKENTNVTETYAHLKTEYDQYVNNFIPENIKTEIDDLTSNPIEESLEQNNVEEQSDQTLAEESSFVEEPLVESLNEEPLVESLNEEPLVESLNEEPLVEALHEEPLVEEASFVEEPLVEEASHEEPLVEALNEEPAQELMTSIPMDEAALGDILNYKTEEPTTEVYSNANNITDLEQMTLKELQVYAKQNNIKVKGKKSELITRIKEAQLN